MGACYAHVSLLCFLAALLNRVEIYSDGEGRPHLSGECCRKRIRNMDGISFRKVKC